MVQYLVIYICIQEILGKKERKMEIRIYQLGLESGYTFMSYDYAKDVIDMEDYQLVAKYTDFDEINEEDDYKLLDTIYWLGNNGTLQQIWKMRSISISDIIEIGEVKYYVDSFGFKKI